MQIFVFRADKPWTRLTPEDKVLLLSSIKITVVVLLLNYVKYFFPELVLP